MSHQSFRTTTLHFFTVTDIVRLRRLRVFETVFDGLKRISLVLLELKQLVATVLFQHFKERSLGEDGVAGQ